MLTRVLPYIFEDPEWRGFFWTSLPSDQQAGGVDRSGNPEQSTESAGARAVTQHSIPLAHSLLNAICVSGLLIKLNYFYVV